MKVTAKDVKQFIFGCADGLTSALGVVLPLALAHHSMFMVIMGLAIASAIGMGGGDYLSDNDGSLRSAVAMAIATAVGTVIPALPFFLLPYDIAAGVSVGLCVATVVAISETKAREMSRLRAYSQTFAIFLAASVATVGFALATGAAA